MLLEQLGRSTAKVEIMALLIFTANLADSRSQNAFHNSKVIEASI